jgi:hypothetical protein
MAFCGSFVGNGTIIRSLGLSMEKRDTAKLTLLTVLVSFLTGLAYALREVAQGEIFRDALAYAMSVIGFFSIAYFLHKYEQWWPPSVAYLRPKRARDMSETLNEYRTKSRSQKIREYTLGFGLVFAWIMSYAVLTFLFQWIFFKVLSV